MKKTKQHIIEHLEQSLSESQESVKKMEKVIYAVKAELWGSGSYKYDFDDILVEVKKIVESGERDITHREAELELLKIENIRYWNLIRSLTGDKTLEKDLERMDTNFVMGRL